MNKIPNHKISYKKFLIIKNSKKIREFFYSHYQSREQVDAFMNYLDFTWIGKMGICSGRRGRPHITHELYSQFEDMLGPAEMPEARCSTNDCLERYNRTLKALLGSHPNLWAFLQSLIGQDSRRLVPGVS